MSEAHEGEAREIDTRHLHIDRKEYWIVFVALAVLTVLEVAIVQVPGIPQWGIVSGLVLMAIGKAALVGLFYMHLFHETNILKLTVLIPMAIPFAYAAILIAEAAWRLA